jgi:hypothetical protein
MRHPAADAVQVDEAAWLGELVGRLVAGKLAGRFLGEHAAGNKVCQHGVQRILVASGHRG